MDNKFYFTDEIMCMMHAFGDCSQPMPASAQLIESIVYEQLNALIQRAGEVSKLRDVSVIGAEDILFLLRKDKSKLVRLINHLYVKDIRQTFNESAGSAEYRSFDVAKTQSTRRVKICYDYLSQLDEFGEYKKVFNQALFDEIKNQRMRRMDSLTKNMNYQEYSAYTKARQVSFINKIKPERFSEWLLANKPETKISVFAFEMIQYLAHETVAQIVDLSLLVKQDAERDPHDPLSVLITRSSHNRPERINVPSHLQRSPQSQPTTHALQTGVPPKWILQVPTDSSLDWKSPQVHYSKPHTRSYAKILQPERSIPGICDQGFQFSIGNLMHLTNHTTSNLRLN